VPEPLTLHACYSLQCSRPRASLIGSTQCLATPGSPLRVGRVVPHFHGWNTCFATRIAPPCQGDGTQLIATLSVQGRASSPRTPKEDASFQSLQSTNYHESSQNRPVHELGAFTLPTLATCVESRTRHACTGRDTSRPRRRWLAVAGITCLEWRIGLGADCASCGLEASTSRDARLAPEHELCGRCQPLHNTRQLDH
jgi:hypothetical protein